MCLDISITLFITVLSKDLYDFSVFYKVFPRNRIKMFLKITINFCNGFFKKFIRFFSILQGFFKKPAYIKIF